MLPARAPLKVAEQLETLRGWVAGGGFCHLRFNDGEVKTMLRIVPPDTTCSGEHYCGREIGDRLLSAFRGICETRDRRVLVGTSMFTEPWHLWACLQADWARENLSRDIEDVPWAVGDFWYTPLGTVNAKPVIALLDSLRTGNRQVVLVSGPIVQPARHCMGAAGVPVPARDAWDDKTVLDRCETAAEQGAIFVWCAGLPAKVWAWEIFKAFPNTGHIDAGSLFDGAFGLRNRSWLMRGSGPHYDICRRDFWPWVLGFVPLGEKV